MPAGVSFREVFPAPGQADFRTAGSAATADLLSPVHTELILRDVGCAMGKRSTAEYPEAASNPFPPSGLT